MQKLFAHIKGSLTRGARSPQSVPTLVAQPKLTQRIAIEGAREVVVPAAFLKSYGIDPKTVVASSAVAPSGVSPEAQLALRQVYEEGGARGPETAAMASGTRALRPEERLYFILVSYRSLKEQALLAFVAPEAAGSSRSLA